MAAAKHTFYIEQGATFVSTLTWADEDGNPIDLTDYSARMQLRESVESEILLDEFTDDDVITLGGVLGTIQLSIPDSQSSAWTFFEAVYDLELEDNSGFVTRLLEGSVIISPEVTR